MILGFATVAVLVLLAIAVLPVRRRDGDARQSIHPTAALSLPTPTPATTPTRATSLREQQLTEEASAIAAEYQRKSDRAWLDELSTKAALLLTPEKP